MSNEVEREAYHKWKSGAEPYGFNGFTAFQAGAEWQRSQSAPADLRQIHGLILNALDRDAAEGKAARGEMAQELRAAIAAQAQSAPAGYVMVPVEPTHEMLEALWGRSFDQFDEGGAKKIARIKYQGLLAAAPEVKP